MIIIKSVIVCKIFLLCKKNPPSLCYPVTGLPHPRDRLVDTSRISSIRMGTTVATNALLERKGDRCALLITKGFHDLLYIGNQSRPKIFDLEIVMPDLIYEKVVEIQERVTLLPQADPKVSIPLLSFSFLLFPPKIQHFLVIFTGG